MNHNVKAFGIPNNNSVPGTRATTTGTSAGAATGGSTVGRTTANPREVQRQQNNRQNARQVNDFMKYFRIVQYKPEVGNIMAPVMRFNF